MIFFNSPTLSPSKISSLIFLGKLVSKVELKKTFKAIENFI